jgi:hypothetical protein
MDHERFDALAIGLARARRPRRRALALLAGAALTGLLAPFRDEAAAEAGCRTDETKCRRGNQCCSGRCKRGACRPAPHQDTCSTAREFCKVGAPGRCGVGDSDCGCFRRLNGAAFCAGDLQLTFCAACTEDEGCDPGTVCVRAVGSFCPGCAAQGLTTMCVRPCRFPSNSQRPPRTDE